MAWDALYEQVTGKFKEAKFIVMDAGYKTPWIAKRTLDDHRIPILPYTNHHYKEGQYRPWEYEYDSAEDTFTCKHGGVLRHTTTTKDGKRTYRTNPKQCKDCPFHAGCGANEKGQKILQTHIWQEYLDLEPQKAGSVELEGSSFSTASSLFPWNICGNPCFFVTKARVL